MLNSISGRNDFYGKYGGTQSLYGQNTGIVSAGLSSKTLDSIYQLSAIEQVGASNFRLTPLNAASFNQFSSDFFQRRVETVSGSTAVSLSASARVQSVLSNFDSDLKPLSGSDARNPLRASLSDNTIISAKVLSSGELRAPQKIQVQQLAQGQSSQSDNFTSKDEVLDRGYLTIQFGAINQAGNQQPEGQAKLIEINTGETLSDLARKINQLQTNLLANVVSDPDGARLQLDGVKTGAAQAFTVTAKPENGLSSSNLNRLSINAAQAAAANRVAQDAKLQIDERVLSNPENNVADKGSNLQLQLLQPGDVNVTIERDSAQLEKNITQFVERVNQAREQLLTIIENSTSELGDGLARREIERFNSTLSAVESGQGRERVSLSDLGVTANAEGQLSVNDARLRQQIQDKPDAINDLFNQALDKLGEAIGDAQKEAAMLNNPFQMTRSSADSSVLSSAIGRLPGNSFSLLQGEGMNWRSLYGIAQYLQVAQFA
ncbi:flagellar filament capping protein FliD [Chitinibacter sp. S2-10]|uniref:flagellar filament capping protein FliD n=1 Tax=Chitinibacter sp. S2-10 TaxID=3373597 RepID=UPI003977B846